MLVQKLKTKYVMQLVEKAKGYITRYNGVITDVEEWGKKKLAYEIQKMHEGFYYFIQFEADAQCPAEVEKTRSYHGQCIKILSCQKRRIILCTMVLEGTIKNPFRSRNDEVMSMNKVILMGRLTRDPEVRYSAGENALAIARYTLAVDRRFRRDGEATADFISCVSFGRHG